MIKQEFSFIINTFSRGKVTKRYQKIMKRYQSAVSHYPVKLNHNYDIFCRLEAYLEFVVFVC